MKWWLHGQADKLAKTISSESESELDGLKPSEEMRELLNAYDQTDTEKQTIIILSLVSPKHYSKTQVVELFGCTKHKVDVARKWRRAYGSLQQRPEKRQFRQKLNLQQAKHFLEFLFGSNLTQDVAYGTTVIKFDSEEKQVLPSCSIDSNEKSCSSGLQTAPQRKSFSFGRRISFRFYTVEDTEISSQVKCVPWQAWIMSLQMV